MSKKKRNDVVNASSSAQPASRSAAAASTSASAGAPAAAAKPGRLARLPWNYIVTFILFWIFCYCIYGDVFARSAEANFITTSDTQMKFLLDKSWGNVYWFSRWGLLVFDNLLLGSVLLSLVLTFIVVLADRLLGLPKRWCGTSALISAAILGWMLSRGTNLYYKSEPSLIVLIPVLVLVVLAVLVLVKWVVLRKQPRKAQAPVGVFRGLFPGAVVAIVLFAGLTFYALKWNENVILTARMQNRTLVADWQGIIDDATSAKRPSRAVAAYYAMALVQTNQLLERLFDLPFDFPDLELDKRDGNEEYGIFLTDASLYAGLVNVAYRCGMDHTVVNGPNLYYLKCMALCAILNEEHELARKYLHVIGSVPFEQDFVEKYTPMIEDRELVKNTPELSCILGLAPLEQRFEQNYVSPAFLGYNAGLNTGSDPSLVTALTACIYSKDLVRCEPHLSIYAQRHPNNLPPVVQQALFLASRNSPTLAQSFPDIVRNQQTVHAAFIMAATPIVEERARAFEGKSDKEREEIRQEYNAKIRAALRDDWIGSYYYYYYCENNDRNQVKPAGSSKSAVN
ncbi:MAG: DUF6057 family protein [Bacteroidales bacterium]|nr:DUF6057 family protein [Bacteroidales bacterium]